MNQDAEWATLNRQAAAMLAILFTYCLSFIYGEPSFRLRLTFCFLTIACWISILITECMLRWGEN